MDRSVTISKLKYLQDKRYDIIQRAIYIILVDGLDFEHYEITNQNVSLQGGMKYKDFTIINSNDNDLIDDNFNNLLRDMLYYKILAIMIGVVDGLNNRYADDNPFDMQIENELYDFWHYGWLFSRKIDINASMTLIINNASYNIELQRYESL